MKVEKRGVVTEYVVLGDQPQNRSGRGYPYTVERIEVSLQPGRYEAVTTHGTAIRADGSRGKISRFTFYVRRRLDPRVLPDAPPVPSWVQAMLNQADGRDV